MATTTIKVGGIYKDDSNGLIVRVFGLENGRAVYEVQGGNLSGASCNLSVERFRDTFTEQRGFAASASSPNVPLEPRGTLARLVGSLDEIEPIDVERAFYRGFSRSSGILLMLLALAPAASAQTTLYNANQLTPMCQINPYSSPPVSYELRPLLFDTYTLRYSIAQGSVGMPGSELAYLNISNLETFDHTVAIRVVVAGKPCPYKWEGIVPAGGRVSIGLHADPALSVVGPSGAPVIGRWNFSVVVYFVMPGGDVDLTNYNLQNIEVGTKPGKPIARIPQ